ncbi:NUDIX hydrolase [Consotaella aegiceratis]|uniref:NUDIX hydrolase n=1 Tax=Consotaella aegiceratis TaxID=3097961 RepID=UPI002F4116DC
MVLRRLASTTQVLLLCRTRSLAGEWCQVAGGIEMGEAAWQTALREIKEETALSVDTLYSADICEQFYEPDRDSITLVPVFVAFVGADEVVTLNDEHSDFRWVSFDEAERMVPFPGQRHVLAHIRREFVEREPHPLLRIEPTR